MLLAPTLAGLLNASCAWMLMAAEQVRSEERCGGNACRCLWATYPLIKSAWVPGAARPPELAIVSCGLPARLSLKYRAAVFWPESIVARPPLEQPAPEKKVLPPAGVIVGVRMLLAPTLAGLLNASCAWMLMAAEQV